MHAVMLAKRLQESMDVSFLAQELSAERSNLTGLEKVVLFANSPEAERRHRLKWPCYVSVVVRIRYLLYRLGLLRLLDRMDWIWTMPRWLERRWYKWRMPLPEGLEKYLSDRENILLSVSGI